MKKKKIIEIIPKFKLAGAETMCENLISSYDTDKYEVVSISFFNYKSAITDRLEKKGYKIYFLNKKKGLDLSILKKLYDIFKKEKPDMIHTHLYVLRYVLLPAKLACKNVKIIHTVHNVADKEISKGRWLHKVAFHRFGVIPVAISELVKDSIIKIYNLNASQVPVIYNGINLDNCMVKHSYKKTGIILHVGRFTKQKNHIELINVFEECLKKCSDLKLFLVGDGELKSDIYSFAKRKGIEKNINFIGTVNECYSIMNQADMFIMTSKWEGMPMTIIEAMGTGLPVVSYPVGGIPDMIEDNVNGFLPKNGSEMVNKIIEMESNENLRKKIGKNSVKRSKVFSSIEMAKLYSKFAE